MQPAKMIQFATVLLPLVWLALSLPPNLAAGQPPVVFVTGDDEYRSEYSMPMIAKILEARHGMRTSIAYARPTPQTQNNIEGLEALEDADLAVIYVRFRQLPDGQLKLLLDFVNSGNPLVGLRTTTHAFMYGEGHKQERLNDGFGIDVFGQKWIRHHGHASSTDVSVARGRMSHPILRGVDPEFHVPSWLYVVDPLHGDSMSLLIGRTVNPGKGVDHGPPARRVDQDLPRRACVFHNPGPPGRLPPGISPAAGSQRDLLGARQGGSGGRRGRTGSRRLRPATGRSPLNTCGPLNPRWPAGEPL